MKMKKNFLLVLSVLSFFVFSIAQAQSKNTTDFSIDQQAKVEKLKQEYLSKGFPDDFAQERAEGIVRSENKVQVRSRVATPSSASIRVDRDTSNWGNYHPVYHAYTPEQMVKKILLSDSRAENAITNVQFIGTGWDGTTWTQDDRSLHYFENGSGIDVPKGLLLATGPALNAEGPNNGSGSMGGGVYVTGDPDLSSICTAVRSGSILEFDFVPFASKATFDFIFASEEYGDYSNKHNVNDAFGFFVSKVGSSGTTNIAKFPNDSAVTISNSNWGYRGNETAASYAATPADTTGYATALVWESGMNGYYLPYASPIAVNPQWHVPNHTSGGPSMEYDGRTVKLQAVANNLVVGEKYHLKLAICNKGDDALGSAVFLANLDLGVPTAGIESDYVGKYWDPAYDQLGLENLYCDCKQTLSLGFTPEPYDRNVLISYMGIAENRIVHPNGENLPDMVKLAAGDSLIKFTFTTLEVPEALEGQQGAIVASIVGGGSDTTDFFYFYNRPMSNVHYIMPTTGYAGKLELNLKGGSPNLFRSINGGLTWENAHQPFTKSQIESVGYEGTIILKEPNSCFDVRIPLQKGQGNTDVPREVFIPKVSGADTYPAPGVHYVPSRNDYAFTIMPTNANAGMVPVVTTGRTSIPDSEGVFVTKNENGTFSVNIFNVQESIKLNIGFSAGNMTSNTEIDNEKNNVWGDNGQLYVLSSETGLANIYNITGMLIKTIPLVAGETSSTSLYSGIYIVQLNDGRSHKVVLR